MTAQHRKCTVTAEEDKWFDDTVTAEEDKWFDDTVTAEEDKWFDDTVTADKKTNGLTAQHTKCTVTAEEDKWFDDTTHKVHSNCRRTPMV